MELKEIREAVARGWCYPATEKKVMDVALAEAISIEILNLYAAEQVKVAEKALSRARADQLLCKHRKDEYRYQAAADLSAGRWNQMP